MKTLSLLYSRVQSQIGDLSFSKIQRAEYVDYAQRIIEDLASETKVWINTATIIPNPTATPVDPIPKTALVPANLSLRRIYRLTRNGKEAREYSIQTIASAAAGNFGFSINHTEFDGLSFATQSNPDESVTIQFVQGFELDEEIKVEYLAGRPFSLTLWHNAISVPDWLADCIEEGIRMQCFKLLFNQGDNTQQARYQNSERLYKDYLRKAISYTRNFLDEHSPLQMQPMIWLGE